MKPTMPVVIMCLVLAMILLVITVQAQDVLPCVTDSPPAPLPPPSPHSLSCDEKCSTECAEKRIFRRMICYGVCMAKCTILPLDHANFPCNQSCVVKSLRSIPNEKHVDGAVNPCHNKCT